jgi:hypothetical protein
VIRWIRRSQTFIFGPPDDRGPSAAPFLAENGRAVSVIGSGEQLWAAVFVGDVADALSRAALDPAAPTGTFALAGPEALTVDAFIDAINHHHVRKRHLRRLVARGLACCLPTLTESMVDVLAADSLADGPLITDVLGLERRRVGHVHQDLLRADRGRDGENRTRDPAPVMYSRRPAPAWRDQPRPISRITCGGSENRCDLQRLGLRPAG